MARSSEDVSGRPGVGPISVRARFERFPATVKGAFIFRGEDADPHQVVLREANVVGIGLGTTSPMPVASVTLDVAPHRDVFVPFEMPITDLDPGWYTMTCALEVDGTPGTFDGGRRFVVAWPRSTVRRGPVRVGRAVELGEGTTVLVEQIDCAGDSSKLHLRVDPPTAVRAKLTADGDRVEVLDTEADEAGRVRVTAYPLLRSASSVRIELRGERRGAAAELDVALP